MSARCEHTTVVSLPEGVYEVHCTESAMHNGKCKGYVKWDHTEPEKSFPCNMCDGKGFKHVIFSGHGVDWPCEVCNGKGLFSVLDLKP